MRRAHSAGATSGLLIMLLGIWGLLIPFIGPYFDYSFGTNAAWHYTTDRLLLNILPGVVAMLAGVLLVASSSRAVRGLGAWLALLAGTWFLVGPTVSLTWEHGAGPIGPPLYGSTRQMLELVGYFYGLGALIVALAAFAGGRLLPQPELAGEGVAAAGTEEPSVTTSAESAERPVPAAETEPVPARRRFPFPRRGGRRAHPPRAGSPTQRQ